MAEDTFNLERFVVAQSVNYDEAVAELTAGEKQSHWMWYVFPQIRGLGRTVTARKFAISGSDEACAYLAHPILGSRLRECCRVLLDSGATDADRVFGFPDVFKLRSSMTLFREVADPSLVFQEVLDRFYGGEPDQRTLDLLESEV